MKKLLLFLLFTIFLCGRSYSQNEMFKALFMYNFTKYILWPTSYQQGDFVITVVGNSSLYGELTKIAEKKKANMQNIVIKQVNSVNEIGKSHIVYLSPSSVSMLNSLVEHEKGKPTVIITDNPGLCTKGAGINYVLVDGKQKYEINQKNIEAQGLKVGSYLLTLGISCN